MFEYKVLEVHSAKESEKVMNEMAKDGWRVISTFMWQNFRVIIIITFEREI